MQRSWYFDFFRLCSMNLVFSYISLGTVITEWDDGKAHCAEFLKSSDSILLFVKQLVNIACFHKFDGWLINIENPIEVSNSIQIAFSIN